MKLKFVAVAAIAFLTLGAFLAGGISLSRTSAQSAAKPIVVQQSQPAGVAKSTEQDEANEANEPAGQSEAAEAASLQAQATITQQQAEATAFAASPGTTVVKTDLDDENGTVAYNIELSNGKDVEVNAKSGVITATEQAGNDQGNTEQGDDEQDEGNE